MKVTLLIFVLFPSLLCLVEGHGRLMEPPSRSSIWRRPEYDYASPPINYNDNELFCGGFEVQYNYNDGKCGLCGDAWNQTQPRDNEHGGFYGKGIMTSSYTMGQNIDIIVELTFGHLGYFEFRICNMDEEAESEACFEKNLLQLSVGGTQFPIPDLGAHWYKIEAILPPNLVCNHCVLQWHYNAGNSWGECEDGSWDVGCGDQENFRGCADISISANH